MNAIFYVISCSRQFLFFFLRGWFIFLVFINMIIIRNSFYVFTIIVHGTCELKSRCKRKPGRGERWKLYCFHFFGTQSFSKNKAILQNYFRPIKIHHSLKPNQVVMVKAGCCLPPAWLARKTLILQNFWWKSCGCHLGVYTCADICSIENNSATHLT